MSTIRNKLESGVSKIQDGIDNNKNKIDDKKIISKYNKIIEEFQCKRDNLLLEIGSLVYEKVRRGEIDNQDICDKCKHIVEFDYTIYDNKRNIQEINKKYDEFLCDCGAKLSEDVKFCSGCGKKVELCNNEIDEMDCSSCGMSIPSDSDYCPCCGYKVEFDFSTFQV